MRFLIEVDGVILDQRPMFCALHKVVAAQVGWSHLSDATFWRTLRKGDSAAMLPAAPPAKLEEYAQLFCRRAEDDESIAGLVLQDGAGDAMASLSRAGSVVHITLGSNHAARAGVLTRAFKAKGRIDVRPLSADVRKRPGELKSLTGADNRSMVVASSDGLIRAARDAEVFTVGISAGVCSAARLHRAGADVVYTGLQELAESVSQGASDLVRAGLLPAPLQ